MSQSKLFILSLIILLVGFMFPQNAEADIKCSGLTVERIQYGYALTSQGIIFVYSFGGLFSIYEHVPFSDEDLLPIILFTKLEVLFDIHYADDFVIYRDGSYLFFRYLGPAKAELLFEIKNDDYLDEPNEYFGQFYKIGSDFILVSYGEDECVRSIFATSDQGELKDITEIIYDEPDIVLACLILEDGLTYLITQKGIYETDRSSAKWYFWPEGSVLNEPCRFSKVNDRYFVISKHSIQEVSFDRDVLKIKREIIPGGADGLFAMQDRVLVSQFLSSLFDFDTGELYEGCEGAWEYLQVGNDIYGILRVQILAPYK